MILLRRKKHHVVENHVIEIHVGRGTTVLKNVARRIFEFYFKMIVLKNCNLGVWTHSTVYMQTLHANAYANKKKKLYLCNFSNFSTKKRLHQKRYNQCNVLVQFHVIWTIRHTKNVNWSWTYKSITLPNFRIWAPKISKVEQVLRLKIWFMRFFLHHWCKLSVRFHNYI